MLEYLAGEMMNKKLLPLLTVAIVNFATAKSSNVLDFCLSKEVDKSSCLSSWLSKSDELLEHRGISNSNNGALFHSVFTGDYKETSIDSPNEIIAYRLKCSDKDEIYNFNYETNELFKYNINKDEVLHEIDKSHHELKIHLESEKKEKIIIDTFSTNDIQYYNSVISFFRILKALKLEQNIQNNQTLKDKIESKDQTILSMICEEAKSSKSITDSTNSIITNSRLIINDEKLIEKLDDLLLCCSELQGPEEGPKMYAMMNGMFSLLLGQNNDESSNEGEAPDTLERRIVDQVQDIMNECCEKITSIGNFDHHLLTYAMNNGTDYQEFTENHLNELTEPLTPEYALQMTKSIISIIDLSCGISDNNVIPTINIIATNLSLKIDANAYGTFMLDYHKYLSGLNISSDLLNKLYIASILNLKFDSNETVEELTKKSIKNLNSFVESANFPSYEYKSDFIYNLIKTLWNDYIKPNYTDPKASDMISQELINVLGMDLSYMSHVCSAFVGESNSTITEVMKKYINIVNEEDDISITTTDLTGDQAYKILDVIYYSFDIDTLDTFKIVFSALNDSFGGKINNDLNVNAIHGNSNNENAKNLLSYYIDPNVTIDNDVLIEQNDNNEYYVLNYFTNKSIMEIYSKVSNGEIGTKKTPFSDNQKIKFMNNFASVFDVEKSNYDIVSGMGLQALLEFSSSSGYINVDLLLKFIQKSCCYIKAELPILFDKYNTDKSNQITNNAINKLTSISNDFQQLLMDDSALSGLPIDSNVAKKMNLRKKLGCLLDKCSLSESDMQSYAFIFQSINFDVLEDPININSLYYYMRMIFIQFLPQGEGGEWNVEGPGEGNNFTINDFPS